MAHASQQTQELYLQNGMSEAAIRDHEIQKNSDMIDFCTTTYSSIRNREYCIDSEFLLCRAPTVPLIPCSAAVFWVSGPPMYLLGCRKVAAGGRNVLLSNARCICRSRYDGVALTPRGFWQSLSSRSSTTSTCKYFNLQTVCQAAPWGRQGNGMLSSGSKERFSGLVMPPSLSSATVRAGLVRAQRYYIHPGP